MLINNDSQKREQELLDKLTSARKQIYAELGKAIIGQLDVIDQILLALFAGGQMTNSAGAPRQIQLGLRLKF